MEKGKKEKKESEPETETPKTPPAPPAQPVTGAESAPPPPEGFTVEQEEPQNLEDLIKIRKIAQAKNIFLIKINKNTELVMKEITQDELIEIDNILVKKEVALDSPSYLNELKLMKLAFSITAIKFKGRKLPVKGINEVADWLRGEGEAVMSFLYIAYDTEISNIFMQLEKKS